MPHIFTENRNGKKPQSCAAVRTGTGIPVAIPSSKSYRLRNRKMLISGYGPSAYWVIITGTTIGALSALSTFATSCTGHINDIITGSGTGTGSKLLGSATVATTVPVPGYGCTDPGNIPQSVKLRVSAHPSLAAVLSTKKRGKLCSTRHQATPELVTYARTHAGNG